MKLKEDKQLFYRTNYSLGLMKFKTLKTYIKTNLHQEIFFHRSK